MKRCGTTWLAMFSLLWCIREPHAAPVQVLSPSGPEPIYDARGPIEIEWQLDLDEAGTAVYLELWQGERFVQDLGNDYDEDARGTALRYLTQLPSGDDYRIRAISAYNDLLDGFSSEPFSIRGQALWLGRPRDGEFWAAGSYQWIQWKTLPLFAGTEVELTLLRGEDVVYTWGTFSDLDGEGFVRVVVPNVPTGSQYRVRIQSLFAPAIIVESEQISIEQGRPNRVEGAAWMLYP